MVYTKTVWADAANRYDIKTQASAVLSADIKLIYVGSAGGTALSSTNFNNMEDGIDALSDQTWQLLSTTTTVADAAQINISVAAFDYYKIRIDKMCSTAAETLRLRLNGDTATDTYNYTSIVSAVNNGRATFIDTHLVLPATADGQSSMEIEIQNIQIRVKLLRFHGCLSQNGSSSNSIGSAGWKNITDLISQINLYVNAGNIVAGAVIKVWGCNSGT